MAQILVVEDSPTMRAAIEQLLNRKGHEVHTARDALGAMAMLESTVPDLMLLDILLPGIGGIELCSLLRINPRYASMPIVMVTSFKNEASLAHHVGADAFITKPFSEEEMIDTVNRLLAVERMVSRAARWPRGC